MLESHISIRVLAGFDDPGFGRADWNALLKQGNSDVVFLTWEWQKAWWESFNRTGLMLLLAERDGRPMALAPFFAEEGMVYFVGSGGSDYLDFIGNVKRPGVLSALLASAREQTQGFVGFLLYHILEDSPTCLLLEAAAAQLGLTLTDEGGMPAPMVDFVADPEATRRVQYKKSLVRAERALGRDGIIEVIYLHNGDEILPYLEMFMAQHIARWVGTPHPSLFLEPVQRTFYETLTKLAAHAGWLRFTCILWSGRAVAFHYGFSYGRSYLFYKPSFDIEMAARSPGQVLMRYLLIEAVEEGVQMFDLGLGDEEFKQRFAMDTRHVKNRGLYANSGITLS